MYVRGITIFPRDDSVMGKGLKKLIKGLCPLRDMATASPSAWELKIPFPGHSILRNLPNDLWVASSERLGHQLGVSR